MLKLLAQSSEPFFSAQPSLHLGKVIVPARGAHHHRHPGLHAEPDVGYRMLPAG
jgi:hypothetical protein